MHSYEQLEKSLHNRSSSSPSQNRGIPKLDLSQVCSKKDLEEASQDGIFNQEPMLDLSTKRMRDLVMTADISSMLKVREEALNYKIKKEKHKIQKLLSSQKISPRTSDFKEHELERWVDMERQDIDKTKQIYEENKKKTEDIIKETMGVDHIFSNYEITQETLKKLFTDKVTTPREGLSFRSGFNSSRRLYELGNMNKHMSSVESAIVQDSGNKLTPISDKNDDKALSSQRSSACDLTLRQKIENKLKAEQEITFEKNKDAYFFEQNSELNNNSIELVDAFKVKKVKKQSNDAFDLLDSERDSMPDPFDPNETKLLSKTPNIFEESDEYMMSSGKKKSSPEYKDTSKSLDIVAQFKQCNIKDEQELKKGANANSVSLIRIKSEHNLKEEQEEKYANRSNNNKEKTYNSKNFFTENFDDQEMEDAINKIKSNPEFDKQSPSPTKIEEKKDVTIESNNIEFCEDQETLSYDEGNWKINLGQTLNRKNEQKIKAIMGSANADFNNSGDDQTIAPPKNSSAILVNDDADEGQDIKDDMMDESSISDNVDYSKDVSTGSEGYSKIINKFDKISQKQNDSNIVDTTYDNSAEKQKIDLLEATKHSKSFEDLKETKNLQPSVDHVSNIDIERIGSPNKPKMNSQEDSNIILRDTRQKIDDDSDEEQIITGSQEVNNKDAKSFQQLNISNSIKPSSMVEYLKCSKLFQEDSLTGDVKVVIDEICQDMVADLDKELFPQRQLFLLTADISSYTLEEAMTLLKDLTPRKERKIVEKILEKQNQERRKKKGKIAVDNGKIVLYEKKGIRTDLVAVENYVEAMHKYIEKDHLNKFMNDLFSSVKHDPFEMLNELQNSDIGSYKHFEVDMEKLSVLQLDTYLAMEGYWRQKEKEEDKVVELEQKEQAEDPTKPKSKPKRRRFEFDQNGLTPEQIYEKKKVFRECEHIHNKALFDCVNEALVQFRPHGKDGEPAPWSNRNRVLQSKPNKEKNDIKKVFDKVRHQIFRWSIMQAGILPRKEFIFKTFDDDLFAEVREKKLATLLATEVIENEPKWLSYDFEEAQVRIDLGDMILEQLVTEAITIMNVVDDTEHKKSIFSDPELVEQLVINESYFNERDLYDYDYENEDYYNEY